ncbi:MAG: energy transducer TonB [Sphingomonadales bacterium]
MKIQKFVIAVTIISAVLGMFAAQGSFAADDRKAWFREVRKIVAKKQTYPRAALMRSIEGRAKLRVSIDREGAVQSFEVVEGTGHSVLDRELSRIAKRINPLPKPPSNFSDADLTFVIPLNWSLN